MRIVTSGMNYLDIDGYGGIVAYAELLNTLGQVAKPVSGAPFNESIPETVRSWPTDFSADFRPHKDDTFSVIDVSDPEAFDPLVELDRVREVIDHHPGYEDYWGERIGEGADIDYIGAACTLIYERWADRELAAEMSQTSAKLLVCGILDNTLNFKAHVTTARDREAYTFLMNQSGLPAGWPAQYFGECQAAIFGHIDRAVKDDSKVLTFQTYTEPLAVGQLVVWGGSGVLAEHAGAIERVMSGRRSGWFMNLVSVDEGNSYFLARDSKIQAWLGELLGVRFTGDVAKADRLWLRKEIIKEDLID